MSAEQGEIKPREANIYNIASVLGGMALEEAVRKGGRIEIPAIDGPRYPVEIKVDPIVSALAGQALLESVRAGNTIEIPALERLRKELADQSSGEVSK